MEIKYRGDDGFNVTVLNTLKILSKAKDIFTATTRSLTDKQLLLHLLFKQIVLQEGIISCILNQPFSFILSDNVLKATENDTATKNESCELQEAQGLQGDFDGFLESVKNERFEPQILLKNQEVRSQNLPSDLSGCERTISFDLLQPHRNAIVSCKDQLKYAITRFGLS